jgi:hypothetical protein
MGIEIITSDGPADTDIEITADGTPGAVLAGLFGPPAEARITVSPSGEPAEIEIEMEAG